MTKLDDEFAAVKDTVISGARTLHDNIDRDAPHWLVNLINRVIYSPATPWFLFGMSFEALGLTVQLMFGIPAYPIFDFIVGAGLGVFVLYLHDKHYRAAGDIEDGEDTDAEPAENPDS